MDYLSLGLVCLILLLLFIAVMIISSAEIKATSRVRGVNYSSSGRILGIIPYGTAEPVEYDKNKISSVTGLLWASLVFTLFLTVSIVTKKQQILQNVAKYVQPRTTYNAVV